MVKTLLKTEGMLIMSVGLPLMITKDKPMWNKRELDSHYHHQVPLYLDYCGICGSSHSKQVTDRESDIIRSLILYGVTDEQMDMLNNNPSLYEFLADFSKWAAEVGY